MPPLIPLQILWRDPVGLNSVDSPGACRCDDGCDYVVKDGAKDRHTPHNEWFCSSLAESIGIPGPPYGVIEEAPGAFVFGSRWEGGVTKENWWEMVARGDIALDEIKPALSKILRSIILFSMT
jgi:hypothetical protein